MITVSVDGLGPLLVRDDVATALNLFPGQNISSDMMWLVIAGNGIPIADEIDRLKAAGEHGLPDTSKIREEIKRINDELVGK